MDRPRPGQGETVESLSDEAVVARVLAGEPWLFEILMRRHNQRLFRTVAAMVHDDGETEDVLQEAYVRAYQSLDGFEGRAAFSTWLTRIAIHEVYARRRKQGRFDRLEDPPDAQGMWQQAPASPEAAAGMREMAELMTRAVYEMPEGLRVVLVLRDVEGLETDETARCLGLTSGNVKVRLHRARALLRDRIEARMGAGMRELFQFGGERCDRVVAHVLQRLGEDRS